MLAALPSGAAAGALAPPDAGVTPAPDADVPPVVVAEALALKSVLTVDMQSWLAPFVGIRHLELKHPLYATGLPWWPRAAASGAPPPPEEQGDSRESMISGDAVYAPPPPAGGGGTSAAVAGSPVLGAATASSLTSPPATVECVVWPGGGGSEDDGNCGVPVAAPVMFLATSWVHPAALPKRPLRALHLHSVPACGARLPPRHHLRLAVSLTPSPVRGRPHAATACGAADVREPAGAAGGNSHELQTSIGRVMLPVLSVAALCGRALQPPRTSVRGGGAGCGSFNQLRALFVSLRLLKAVLAVPGPRASTPRYRRRPSPPFPRQLPL